MKKTHIIAIAIIAVAVGVIISTLADSSTFVDFAKAEQSKGKTFQVVGVLNKEKEMVYNPQKNANLFSFYMLDKNGKECKVHYKGAKPQDFERSEQIVLTGKMQDEYFEAEKILMKCPSKYNNGETVEVSSEL